MITVVNLKVYWVPVPRSVKIKFYYDITVVIIMTTNLILILLVDTYRAIYLMFNILLLN